jgi:hypothetical protein
LTTHRADVSAKASKTVQRFHPAIVFRSFSRRRHFEKSTFFGSATLLLLLLQRKPFKRARASKATTPLTNESLKNVSRKRKRDETTPKIEKNVGTFTGGGVKKHVNGL